MKKKAICILSGGMDSTLASYIAKSDNYDIITLHFNYGQRTQNKELKAFHDISASLNAIKTIEYDLAFLKKIGGSALTDSNIDVPTHGLEDGVPPTYVPYRNGIFISIAASLAEKENARALYIGVVQEDSSGYPDCTEEFIKSINTTINQGSKPETKITIKTPLIHLSKAQIVEKSLKTNVPLKLTWSCYSNENEACGVCDSCRLRLNGFKKAGVKDPIKYKDNSSK